MKEDRREAIRHADEGAAVIRLVPSARPAQRALASPTERSPFVDRRLSIAPQLRDVDRYNRRFYERCWRAASLVSMQDARAPAKAEGLQGEMGCGLPLCDALFEFLVQAADAHGPVTAGRHWQPN